MELSILGSAGSEAPGLNPPAFLIDNFLMLDAGTVALSLEKIAQCAHNSHIPYSCPSGPFEGHTLPSGQPQRNEPGLPDSGP